MVSTSILHLLKDAFGVIYFLSWSATFWPQVILNHRRRSTQGLSHDFVAMSATGFIAYTFFTFLGYFSPSVRSNYTLLRGSPPPIETADVLFAAHASLLTCILIGQVILLRPGPSARTPVVLACAFVVVCVLILLAAAASGRASWVAALEFCGAVKVLTSIVKHFPQAWANYLRKSTVGWSYAAVVLDVVGGGFSLAQQGVRCGIEGSWRPFTQNLSKLCLAGEALLFDFFFVVQHVWLYRDRYDEALYEKVGRGEEGREEASTEGGSVGEERLMR